jgi:hypothetical protein
MPPTQEQMEPEVYFASCVAHCLKFKPSREEDATDRTWLLVGSLAESNQLFDIAFEIYAKLSTKNSGGLSATVIESRIRMALLVGMIAKDYELASELLGLESNAVENISHDFVWLRELVPTSLDHVQRRTEFQMKINDIKRTMRLPDILGTPAQNRIWKPSTLKPRKRFGKDDVGGSFLGNSSYLGA